MKVPTLVLLATIAAPAHAALIGVEYEGVIDTVGEGPLSAGGRTFDYDVGDRIAGRLIIDTSLARSGPSSGSYESSYSGFVSGIFPVLPLPDDEFDPESGDFVGLSRGRLDSFFVQDGYIQANTNISFIIEVSAREFLNGVGLNQSFELRSSDINEPDERMAGGINEVNEAWNSIGFLIDRLTVKPAHCFAKD